MSDLREALKRTCAALNVGEQTAVAFLRSLEESGWKMHGPEATAATKARVRAILAGDISQCTEDGLCRAFHAALPTIAELLEEKKG